MASNFCLCVLDGLRSRNSLLSTLSRMSSSPQGNFSFSVSVKQTPETNEKKVHSYAKNKVKVTLMRWLKPPNPRVFIDWKLRPHPSPARTYLDISQEGILSVEGDLTFGRKLDSVGSHSGRWPLFPFSSHFSSPVTLPPSFLLHSLLCLFLSLCSMLLREKIYLVTLN